MNTLCDGLQQQIANIMPQAVIHVLEAVQVEIEQGETLITPLGRFDDIFHMFIEIGPACQSGQLVRIGQLTNALFCFALLGDVLNRSQYDLVAIGNQVEFLMDSDRVLSLG